MLFLGGRLERGSRPGSPKASTRRGFCPSCSVCSLCWGPSTGAAWRSATPSATWRRDGRRTAFRRKTNTSWCSQETVWKIFKPTTEAKKLLITKKKTKNFIINHWNVIFLAAKKWLNLVERTAIFTKVKQFLQSLIQDGRRVNKCSHRSVNKMKLYRRRKNLNVRNVGKWNLKFDFSSSSVSI